MFNESKKIVFLPFQLFETIKKALSIFLNIKGDQLSKKHLLSEFINPIKKGAYHELECLVR